LSVIINWSGSELSSRNTPLSASTGNDFADRLGESVYWDTPLSTGELSPSGTGISELLFPADFRDAIVFARGWRVRDSTMRDDRIDIQTTGPNKNVHLHILKGHLYTAVCERRDIRHGIRRYEKQSIHEGMIEIHGDCLKFRVRKFLFLHFHSSRENDRREDAHKADETRRQCLSPELNKGLPVQEA
jgi:hypothetical protein